MGFEENSCESWDGLELSEVSRHVEVSFGELLNVKKCRDRRCEYVVAKNGRDRFGTIKVLHGCFEAHVGEAGGEA